MFTDCTKFRLRDETGKDYTDIIEIYIIELKKLKYEKKQFSKENSVEEWIRFFKCRTEADVEMLLRNTKNPGIKEAIGIIRNMLQNNLDIPKISQLTNLEESYIQLVSSNINEHSDWTDLQFAEKIVQDTHA